VCLKSSGQVPHDSQECSCFLSPNGKTFRSLELALQYHRELEKAKLEKENRRLMKGSFGLENTVTKVNNSSMLGCNYCEQKFFAPSMVKKHERDVHRMYSSSRMINCEHCSESFQATPLLQKHVREFHTKQQCKFCGKQFESIYRLDTHVLNHHRKSSVPQQPLNLQQREPPKKSYQYNPREIEDRMAEIVNRNPNAPREVKQFLDSNQSSRAAAGISFSGPSLKNPKSNLNSGSKKAVGDSQGNTSQSLIDEGGYCVICQDAHKMISSCLQDVMCKNCSIKGHLRIDCPQDSVALEEMKRARCGIKRKAQVVEGNISIKVCYEVLSKSSCHPNVKFELESNEIIAPDDIKVENQKPVSMKQEYYEDDIIMKKEGEYFKETNPSPVKSEHIVDNPSSSVIDSVSCLWTMSHLQKDEGKT